MFLNDNIDVIKIENDIASFDGLNSLFNTSDIVILKDKVPSFTQWLKRSKDLERDLAQSDIYYDFIVNDISSNQLMFIFTGQLAS